MGTRPRAAPSVPHAINGPGARIRPTTVRTGTNLPGRTVIPGHRVWHTPGIMPRHDPGADRAACAGHHRIGPRCDGGGRRTRRHQLRQCPERDIVRISARGTDRPAGGDSAAGAVAEAAQRPIGPVLRPSRSSPVERARSPSPSPLASTTHTSYRWTSESVQLLIGEALYAVAAVRDASERRRTEAALRGAADYTRAAIDQAPDAMLTADLDGRYTDVNAAACGLLGYRREELIGKTIQDLIPPEDAPRLLASRQRMLTAGQTDIDEWRLRRQRRNHGPRRGQRQHSPRWTLAGHRSRYQRPEAHREPAVPARDPGGPHGRGSGPGTRLRHPHRLYQPTLRPDARVPAGRAERPPDRHPRRRRRHRDCCRSYASDHRETRDKAGNDAEPAQCPEGRRRALVSSPGDRFRAPRARERLAGGLRGHDRAAPGRASG